MNIPPNRFPYADAAPSAAPARGTGDYGGGFEAAIRDLQKDQPQREAVRDDRPSEKSGQGGDVAASTNAGPGRASAGEQGADGMPAVEAGSQATAVDPEGADGRRAKNQEGSDRMTMIRGVDAGQARNGSDAAASTRKALETAMRGADIAAAMGKLPAAEQGEKDAASLRDAALAGSGDDVKAGEDMPEGGDTRDQRVTDLLDRLLGASLASQNADLRKQAADAASGAGETDAALEERVVVVSLMPGEAEAPSDAAVQARGKVRLEVLHMETHFEPRSDAVVLIEAEAGQTSAFEPSSMKSEDARADARAGREDGKLRISFDEALARLGSGQGATAGEGNPRGREARDDRADLRAARAEAEKPSARTGQAASTPAFDAGDKAVTALPIASMTDQVAGRIVDALGSSAAAARQSDRPTGETVLRMTAGGAALKTLTIQLQPEHLGVLDVSMRLVDGQLTLELAASEANTAKVLAEDREGLRKLLQHAGFSLEDASITIVTRDASTQAVTRTEGAGNASASQRDDGGSQNPGQSFADRDARGDEPGRRQDEPARGGRTSADPVAPRARSASTFL